MMRSDFAYDLPEQLIAQVPAAQRTQSRLLVLTQPLQHLMFADLIHLLAPQDLLVVNDTKVIRARLMGIKDSGGRAEILIERLLTTYAALAQVRVSKPLKEGRFIALEGTGGDALLVMVVGRRGDLYELEFPQPILAVLEQYGQVPLPPYIRRSADAGDTTRYQTMFAQRPGAVAAPTAGLHFDSPLLSALAEKGVRTAAITLHVGLGTFQPIRSQSLLEHRMHSEWMDVSQSVVEAVGACRQRGGRVVAVGTTVVRALESAALSGELRATSGETSIFIYPPFQFRVVDALITNFHLPESSLLMLVAAFAGREHVLSAYGEAVAREYRFFSYGDAMLLTRNTYV